MNRDIPNVAIASLAISPIVRYGVNFKTMMATLALAAIWGGSFPFIRLAVRAFGPLPLMAGRTLIAAVLLAAVMAALRRPLGLRRYAPRLLVLGLMNAAIPFTLIAAAELHLSASLAATLNATVPMFTAVLSVFWLGESLSVRRVMGLALGIAGVAVLVGWEPAALTPVFLWSVAAMLAAALCYAFGGVFAKKYLADAPAPTLALGQQLAAGAWLLLPALWQRPAHVPAMSAIWALVALSVVCTAGAYLLYFYLIARVGPIKTYTVTYLIPLFGMLWGAAFLGETLSRGMFAGLALILASLALVNDVRLRYAGVWWRVERRRRAQRSGISATLRSIRKAVRFGVQLARTGTGNQRQNVGVHLITTGFGGPFDPIEEKAEFFIGLERLFARKREEERTTKKARFNPHAEKLCLPEVTDMSDQDTSRIGEFLLGGELAIHRLGFGAMRVTGTGIWGEPEDREEALRLLCRLPELGVNFIDTADSYGPDVSERLLREALYPYKGLVIATKAGQARPGPREWIPLGRPEYLIQQAYKSLRQLGVEQINLWQLHRIDPKVPCDEQFDAVKSLLDAGLIRYAGLSEVTVEEIEAAAKFFPVATVQNRYNATDRASEAVLDYCEAHGIGFIPWLPLAAGRFAKAGSPSDAIAQRHGASPAQIALAWLLKRSPVMLPIPGTSKLSHLEENVAATGIALSDEEFITLDSVAHASST